MLKVIILKCKYCGFDKELEVRLAREESNEVIFDLLWQGCGDDDCEEIDNACMSCYEKACDYLEKQGWLKSVNGRVYKVLQKLPNKSGSLVGDAAQNEAEKRLDKTAEYNCGFEAGKKESKIPFEGWETIKEKNRFVVERVEKEAEARIAEKILAKQKEIETYKHPFQQKECEVDAWRWIVGLAKNGFKEGK